MPKRKLLEKINVVSTFFRNAKLAAPLFLLKGGWEGGPSHPTPCEPSAAWAPIWKPRRKRTLARGRAP